MAKPKYKKKRLSGEQLRALQFAVDAALEKHKTLHWDIAGLIECSDEGSQAQHKLLRKLANESALLKSAMSAVNTMFEDQFVAKSSER